MFLLPFVDLGENFAFAVSIVEDVLKKWHLIEFLQEDDVVLLL